VRPHASVIEREPGAPPDERDPDVEPRRSSRPQRAPATSLARFRAPGAPPRPSAARSGDPHTDFEAASRHPSARRAGTRSSPPSWSPSRRRTSEVGDPHAHVIAAKKAGHDVGRDQVAPLMAVSGIWGDERRRGVTTTDAVVPTSPLTSFTGSFTRNVRTRAESRTGPPSTPPKRWPTSLTST